MATTTNPTTLGKFVAINPTFLDAVLTVVSFKDPLRVIKQTPAAGMPVPQGTVIEVHAVSYSDIPYSTLVPSAPTFLAKYTAADVTKIIADSAAFRDELAKGAQANTTTLITEFNKSAQKFNIALIPTGTTSTPTDWGGFHGFPVVGSFISTTSSTL